MGPLTTLWFPAWLGSMGPLTTLWFSAWLGSMGPLTTLWFPAWLGSMGPLPTLWFSAWLGSMGPLTTLWFPAWLGSMGPLTTLWFSAWLGSMGLSLPCGVQHSYGPWDLQCYSHYPVVSNIATVHGTCSATLITLWCPTWLRSMGPAVLLSLPCGVQHGLTLRVPYLPVPPLAKHPGTSRYVPFRPLMSALVFCEVPVCLAGIRQ